MKKAFLQLIVSLVVLAAGTAVGVYVEKQRSKEQGELRYLDTQTIISDLLSAPTIPGRDLEILLDGARITQLFGVAVTICNFSDQDFEKVPLFVEMTPSDEGGLEVIVEEVVGANDLREAVSRLDDIEPSTVTGGKRYGYEIETVNRSANEQEPSFRASYLIQGTKPEVTVKTNKKGLELRQFAYWRMSRDETSFVEVLAKVGIIIGIVVVYVIFVLFILAVVGRLQSKRRTKEDNKLRTWIVDKLSAELTERKEELGIAGGEKALGDFLVLSLRQYQWDQIPQFLRRVMGMSRPDDMENRVIGG